MHTPGLNDFPVELLLQIFKSLNVHDLLHCRGVCKALKQLIDNSAYMQYAIQLGKHGYRDVDENGGGSIISKREQFDQFINRRIKLDWVESSMIIPSFSSHALAGGIFAVSDKQTITFVELPSRLIQSPLRTWTQMYTDFQVADFFMDPGQDLLVLVELQQLDGVVYDDDVSEDEYDDARYKPVLRLRTLSAETDHPRAVSPILFPNCHANREGVQVTIMNNTLGCLCKGDATEPAHFTVWNWCTGEIECAVELHRDVSTFVFIGPKMVLLPSHDNDCDAITVYEIVDQNLREVVSLELFPCVDGVKLAPRLSANPPLDQKPSALAPSWLPDACIIRVQCDVIRADDPEIPICDSYDFFVPMYSIQRLASSGDRGSSLRVQWTEWGPSNSRCILTNGLELNYRIHGNRYVMRDESFISVFDFSPGMESFRNIDDSKEARSHRFDSRSMPSTVSGDPTQYIRLEPVTTCLPYFTSEGYYEDELRTLRYSDPITLMDDEHILLIDYERQDPEADLIILTM